MTYKEVIVKFESKYSFYIVKTQNLPNILSEYRCFRIQALNKMSNRRFSYGNFKVIIYPDLNRMIERTLGYEMFVGSLNECTIYIKSILI